MDGRPIDASWHAIHHTLVPLMRVDNRTNIRYIAREYLGLGLALMGCVAAYQAWQGGQIRLTIFMPLALLGMVAVAAFQHRLSGLAHDASHSTLFRNKLANELASDLLLMFPIVAMTQKYRGAHLGHHQFVNNPALDPDLLRLNHPEPQVFPVSKGEFWRRYVRNALWPPSILRYLLGRAKAANLDSGEGTKPLRAVYSVRVARTMRGTYWLTLLATVHLLHAWPIFWLFWVAPLLTFYPLFMQLREIAHHSNAPDDGDLTNSRVFQVHPILEACVFPYGQSFHLTHHLFAMIPHYQVANAHAILQEYSPYRDNVTVCRGYFFRTIGTAGPSVLDVLEAGLTTGQPRDGDRGAVTGPGRTRARRGRKAVRGAWGYRRASR
jgi:fatty acid desaturase